MQCNKKLLCFDYQLYLYFVTSKNTTGMSHLKVTVVIVEIEVFTFFIASLGRIESHHGGI
jgi:hypothetical protein